MQLRTIVAATDESEGGCEAVLAAARLAERASARLIVMTVLTPPGGVGSWAPVFRSVNGPRLPELDRLARRFEAELARVAPQVRAEYAVAFGVPGVEISRFAESNGADLLVMGRTQRSQARRLLLGDTADAVARRSSLPCLFIPEGLESPCRVLVALDGSERGMTVLGIAIDFARATGGRLRAVTVEARREDEAEQPHFAFPSGKAVKLAHALERSRVLEPCAWTAWEPQPEGAESPPLRVRCGDIVPEILAEVGASGPDVLVIGFHRGGPPGVVEGSSVARRLAHASRSAVLTVPL